MTGFTINTLTLHTAIVSLNLHLKASHRISHQICYILYDAVFSETSGKELKYSRYQKWSQDINSRLPQDIKILFLDCLKKILMAERRSLIMYPDDNEMRDEAS